MALPRTLTPTPAPRPGPRLRRGRSKARAPVARKPCLLAPQGEGLWFPFSRREKVPRRGGWGCGRSIGFAAVWSGVAAYPHPNPGSAPRPAFATRALQGTRASGAQTVPSRPAGRGASA
ncbi:hypothetical protein XarbCFBP7408_12855 [Xanthomonas arboricola pv. guizotiae]|uniref:Uncharacterized protein n=1 Tax=Xanthomonas arboricola pv. guizotiae TaxID=487867 RepID=A0A2S7A3W7_9XANT|nr:hypothetical protein XarbCFBP7409_08390 [Xanthomonas arboricola pv. guizotiae]PPU23075.1 hypothetical protein XarbCFBP7408_12855 [Xanthomonas arboricola pv. guizotiae]